MSCNPSMAEGKGTRIPQEELDRWTDNLHNVLESSDARRHFRDYLSRLQFEESVANLDFWESCEALRHKRPGNHSASHTSSHISLEEFVNEAQALVVSAEEKNIFDLKGLKDFVDAVESRKEDQVNTALQNAMQSAIEELKGDHDRFSAHLLEQRQL